MGLPPARHKKSLVSGSSSTTRQPSPPCEEIEQDEEPNVTSSSSSSSSFFHDSHHHHAAIRRNTCQHRPHSKNGNSRNAFQKALSEKGLEEVEQEGDGNCLFRAVGLQVYGDSDSHMEVRRRCMDFMAKEQAHFAQFIPTHEPFQIYIERKRKDGVHGNNPEIQAISELYNRPVQVYIPSHGATPINIFQSEYKTSDIPIRLAYHDGNHYNAIVDPFLPTAGLGLGLPGLEPGLADKLQMQRAKQESDRIFINQIARQTHDMELKRAMEESSKLASMDYWMMLPKKRALEYSAGAGGVGGAGVGGGDDDLTDATTNFELQEQIALLSSLESYHGHGHGHGHGQSNLLPTGTTSITKSHIGTSTTRKERFEDDVIFPGKGHDKEKEDEIQQGEKNGTVSHHGSISMIDMSVMDMKGHGPTLSHLHDHEHDHPVDSYGATLHHDHEHHHHHPHHHHHHHHPLTMMHHHSKAGGRGGLSNQFLSICIGIVHGISGPGGVLGVIPAVQLHNLTLSVVYLGSFCITSILVMGCFAAMYGMCSSRISESSRVVEIRMEIFSSSLSILVGSMWLILISMGKLHDVFP